jgi:hypothetical protein
MEWCFGTTQLNGEFECRSGDTGEYRGDSVMIVITAAQKALTKFFHLVLSQLQRLLGNHLDPEPADKWPIWKIITIGEKSSDELLEELEREGLFSEGVSWGVKDIMRQEAFTTLPEPQTIPLVRLSVADLGFIDLPSTEELFHMERLHSLGLDLCPAEVGPHLWLQYQDQPEEREPLSLFVAMEPIHGSLISSLSPSHGRIFFLYSDSKEPELCIAPTGPSLLWRLDSELIFTLSPSYCAGAHKHGYPL